jgi:ATP-dependent exoDNAse (exonuclease V) beta subunit
LHIVVPPAGRPNDSWAWLLRHALAGDAKPTPHEDDGGAGEDRVLFETGLADWFAADVDDRAAKSQSSGSGRAGQRAAKPHQIVFAGPPRAAHLHSTPSHGSDDASLDVSDLLSVKSSAARRRGSLYHDWFELVEWLDDGPPADERLTQTAARFHLTRSELESHIAEFHRLAAQPNTQRLLSRASYTDHSPGPTIVTDVAEGATPSVWRELPFALTTEAGWATGRIDRLIVLGDGGHPIAADVIDFKTDNVDKSDGDALQSAAQTHCAQMQAYGRAACKLLGLSPEAVRLRLLFVAVDAVVDVPHTEAAVLATCSEDPLP